jgi:hypothetical protein
LSRMRSPSLRSSQPLGADEGPADGTRLGVLVGPAEGTLLGATVGPAEGTLLGPADGEAVGSESELVVINGSPPLLQQAKAMV